MVTKRRVGCTPSRSWSTQGSLCPRVVFACFPTPRVVPHMGPLFAPVVSRPSSSLLSASSRRRPLESGVGTWRCRCRGWSWSWPCRGRGRYRGGVGRRGGGQHGGVDVVVVDLAWSAWGDGRRRGGDRRGKVDAEGLWSCRRRGVVVVAVHATREEVVAAHRGGRRRGDVVEVVVVGATREEVVVVHRGGRRRGDVVEVVIVARHARRWSSSSSTRQTRRSSSATRGGGGGGR